MGAKVLIGIEILLIITQFNLCGFSFHFILNAIAKLFGISKFFGSRLPIMVILGFEMASLFIAVMMPLLFRWPYPWVALAIQIVLSLVNLTIVKLDSMFYVYRETKIEE